MKKLSKKEKTSRGFEVINFCDFYDAKCSLQQSSIWLDDDNGKVGGSAVWLGVDDANPKIMAKDAETLGVETSETCGWIDYPLPEQVMLTTRMHLNRDQVRSLVGHLQNWLKNGSF